jgi:hypothetical protein
MEKLRVEKKTQEMEFWRNREWSIGEILHTMAVEILLETKNPSFFSIY